MDHSFDLLICELCRDIVRVNLSYCKYEALRTVVENLGYFAVEEEVLQCDDHVPEQTRNDVLNVLEVCLACIESSK